MPRSRAPYPAAFRQQMVDLVRSGRSPEALAKEFEPTAQAIRNWVKQDDLNQGRREDGLTTEERTERAVCAVKTDSSGWIGRSWQKPRPGSPGRPRLRPGLLVHKGASGRLSRSPDVLSAGCLPQRLLRLASGDPSPGGPERTLCFLAGSA